MLLLYTYTLYLRTMFWGMNGVAGAENVASRTCSLTHWICGINFSRSLCNLWVPKRVHSHVIETESELSTKKLMCAVKSFCSSSMPIWGGKEGVEMYRGRVEKVGHRKLGLQLHVCISVSKHCRWNRIIFDFVDESAGSRINRCLSKSAVPFKGTE